MTLFQVPEFVVFLLLIAFVTRNAESDDIVERTEVESKSFKSESVLMGIAKSLIAGKMGTASPGGQNHYCIDRDVYQRSARGFCKISSFTTLSSPCKFFKMANGFCDLPDILSLSLNMSNIVLMLVLRGLIWGISYIQGGSKGSRNEDILSLGGLKLQEVITETDAMLFLGYLVADESGHYDCLSRIACERPSRAENYHKSADIIWKMAKTLDSVIPLNPKYEKILIRLQEAIDYGRANGNCQFKYKCFGQRWLL